MAYLRSCFAAHSYDHVSSSSLSAETDLFLWCIHYFITLLRIGPWHTFFQVIIALIHFTAPCNPLFYFLSCWWLTFFCDEAATRKLNHSQIEIQSLGHLFQCPVVFPIGPARRRGQSHRLQRGIPRFPHRSLGRSEGAGGSDGKTPLILLLHGAFATLGYALSIPIQKNSIPKGDKVVVLRPRYKENHVVSQSIGLLSGRVLW